MTDRLKYREFKLHIDANFWVELEKRKLHDWKLSEPIVPLRLPVFNALSHPTTTAAAAASVAVTDGASATAADEPAAATPSTTAATGRIGIASYLPESFSTTLLHSETDITQDMLDGEILNFNTQQQLVDMDKKTALPEAITRTLLQELRDPSSQWNGGEGAAVAPARAVIFTFADLKTHEFYYCSAFPAVDVETPVNVVARTSAATIFNTPALQSALAAAVAGQTANSRVCVLRKEQNDIVTCLPFNRQNTADEDAIIGFADTAASVEYPGWGLRNVFAYLRLSFPNRTKYRVCVLRGGVADDSYVLDCTVSPLKSVARYASIADNHYSPEGASEPLVVPKVTGWVDSTIHHIEMGGTMDPVRLAESSAKLNLGLMKWRMLPELQLDGIQTVKALLLGSGTLGCNIARHLLMWGVTHVTLVDRGNVSYSNPVRQTLFELNDVLQEGERRVKSVAAAEALKRILPSVTARGVNMTIRMPGHRVDENQRENATKDILALEELICTHDVIYLLTDSRESRWLPTLLASTHNKPVINAALGFDSYVVMRHGVEEQGDERVGCYFCNDVVAPRDSLTARSLDQQCTVTRPGVSAIASAIAVEMLASVYNHPKRFGCPAYRDEDEEKDGSVAKTPLGVVAHQIRGNVSSYALHTLHGKQYNKCTACSKIVTDLYRKEGADFIIQCLNDPLYLEEITGLKAEKEAVAAAYANWDDDDFDDDM